MTADNDSRLGAPRFVGIETEYGIAVDGPSAVSPVLASSLVVAAYRSALRGQVGWDHTDEAPFRDARGEQSTGTSPETPPSDAEFSMANAVLPNGARLYVDHAHPEYATPECTNARDAVIWDRAGQVLLERAAQLAVSGLPEGSRVLLHKNNTDGKGAAYGTHENYLVDRAVPFGRLTAALLPFFASRVMFAGSGRIGTEFDDRDVPYQLSQRADFFEVEVGLETTLKRPLMNTRDEPHADPERYRRLHVINGDATLCEVATFVKVGSMLLVLAGIEQGHIDDTYALVDPVDAFQRFSQDPDLRHRARLVNGRRMTAIELQWAYHELADKALARRDVDDVDRQVIAWWAKILDAAEEGPSRLDGLVDWATKWHLLEAYRQRHGLALDHDRVRMVDLQYHDIRRDRGLHERLVARNKIVRLVDDDEVLRAVDEPPEDTRAWFRGTCIQRFGAQVVAAGWDAIVFDTGRERLQRVPMMDPAKGTRAQLQGLLDTVDTADELIDALTANG